MAKTACFFGHRDTPESVRHQLYRQVQTLIEDGTLMYYVGNHGSFDSIVLNVLRDIKKIYPQISYAVVLSRLPNRPEPQSLIKPEETLFPEGMENVPRRLCIVRRNDWMLKQADTVICYIQHYSGGSGKMVEKAVKQGKRVINIADIL